MALRPLHDGDKRALRFTFGNRMGGVLIKLIRIRRGEGESKNLNEVLLPLDYNSADLSDLGEFIYKATRVWQKTVGRYHQRKGGESYRYTQLYELAEVDDRQHGSLNLNGKQHAAAVRDWFYMSYGNAHGLIGAGANQMHHDTLWGILLHVLGVSFKYRREFGWEEDLQQVVNNHYGCVIKEIRRDRLQLGTLGGIKKIR